MSKTDTYKEQAARAALDEVAPGMRLGLGTGSTTAHFVRALGECVRGGLSVVAVPTSDATARLARAEVLRSTELWIRAEEAFNRDREGFIEGVFSRSEGIKLTGEKAERAKAQAMQMYKAARENKIADRRNKELQVDHMIAVGPRMSVNATGYWLQVGSAPNVQRVLKPDVVRVMHRTWTLEPGINQDVPEIFVRQYELLQRSRMETQERQQAMSATQSGGSMHSTKMEQRLNEIDRKYGVKRQLLGQGV